jgi:hypothetical protein
VENFCEHCQGQRFDRARILRALRQARRDARAARRAVSADEAFVLALDAVRALDLPHLEIADEEEQVVH